MTAVPFCFRSFSRSALRGLPVILPLLACLLLPAGALGATVNGTARNDLDAAVSGTAAGGTVTWGSGVSGTTFTTGDAVHINKQNLTLAGSSASGFSARIAGLVSDLLAGADARKTGTAADLAAWVNSRIGTFDPPAMTTITSSVTRTSTNTAGHNANKLLWVDYAPAGHGLNLVNLRFDSVTAEFSVDSAVNGLIGHVSNNTSDAWLGDLIGNAFTNLRVTLTGDADTDYLAGGGIIGVRATGETLVSPATASASMGSITGNLFRGINVTTTGLSGTSGPSAYIEGGGIIGVDAVSSPSVIVGHALIDTLSDNFFTGITIRSDDVILGGGLVGVNNNSQSTDSTARLNTATGNIFGNGNTGDITVKSYFSLRGGGVIGVNGLSNAAVELDSLTNNVFAGIAVESENSYIKGGGIVGLQSNDGGKYPFPDPSPSAQVRTYLNEASNNLFLNAQVKAHTYLDGGGVIGLRSNEGTTNLNFLKENIFKGLRIETKGSYLDTLNNPVFSLRGGGVVGLSSATSANLADAEYNYFDDITVTVGTAVTDHLHGGGIIGIAANDQATSQASVLGFLYNNIFTNLETSVSGDILGGGIVGGYTAAGAVAGLTGSVGIQGNYFEKTTVTSGGSLTGGGIVGFNAATAGNAHVVSVANNTFAYPTVTASRIDGGGVLGLHSGSGDATIASISNNIFWGDPAVTAIRAATAISGGGVIGVESQNGNAAILRLENNLFSGLNVVAGRYIRGGGVLGAYTGSTGIAYIDQIVRNIFDNLKITAGTYIDGGGVIGATGTVAGGPLAGISLIDGSSFTRNTVRANGSGTDSLIMGGLVYSYGLAGINGMTINNSLFRDNDFYANTVYGTVTVDTGNTAASSVPATLTLTATSGRSTVFQNNRIHEAGGIRTNSLYFGTVDDITTNDATGFITRTPDPAAADARLIVAPEAGGVVALYDPIEVNQNNGKTFDMYVRGAGDFLWGGANNFVLDTASGAVAFESGSSTTLLPGMTLDAQSHDLTQESGSLINVMGWNAANGNKLTVNQANLNGRLHFNLMSNTTPNAVSSSLNTPDRALLSITTPSANPPSVAGATVSLSNFAAGPALRAGDEFYLIDTGETGGPELAAGDPANNRARARQGLTREYEFIVDTNQTHNASALNSRRYLVARLVGNARPPGETRILSEGRAAGLAFLIQGASWLPDHSYRQADLALQAEDAWTPFGGVDGAWLRATSDADIDISATNMMAGLAIKRTGDSASILFGGFFDAGWANYDVGGEFGSQNTHLDGDGYLRYYGGGLMARLRWHNGFRLEGSLRAGALENDFRSTDFVDVDGKYADYNITVPYVAAHAGVGYEWKIAEKHTLDLLGRYYWTHQGGATTTLDTGEDITFDADNSHRVRAGARYTYDRYDDKHLSFYVGAAYEYEFDHKIRARVDAGELDVPSLTGPTGIGEIGMIIRPYKDSNLAVELGLQGYTGMRNGISGGIRLGLEF